MDNLFLELTWVLLLAAGCSVLAAFFKQPSILAYIVAGLFLGPLGLHHLEGSGILHSLSQIGIALLLFMVGLELDTKELSRLGRRIFTAGWLQVGLTGALALLLLLAMDIAWLPAVYLALGLTFSSTIVAVKLLAEKGDLQSLYGRLSLGVFLIQDVVALVVLMFLAGGVGSETGSVWLTIFTTLVKGGGLLLGVWFVSKYFLPRILKIVVRSDELLLIFALGWGLGLAAFAQLPVVGFSLEIGGFLAGLALSGSSLNHEISGRIRPLRDFFVMIFFIILGSQLDLGALENVLLPALVLSGFVLFGKPLILLIIFGRQGFKPRTGFMVGLTAGQVSEFSLILVALGLKLGHLDASSSALMSLVGVITLSVSSYAILRSESLYNRLSGLLAWFDFGGGAAEKHQKVHQLSGHVVLLGAHRTGRELAEAFLRHREKFVIIDFNPDVAEHYARLGVPVVCGDAADPHIQELAGFARARMIVSTLPDIHDNLGVVEAVRSRDFKAKLIFMAQDDEGARELYRHKVDYVLLPHYLNGIHLARILKHPRPHQHLTGLRTQHLKVLGN